MARCLRVSRLHGWDGIDGLARYKGVTMKHICILSLALMAGAAATAQTVTIPTYSIYVGSPCSSAWSNATFAAERFADKTHADEASDFAQMAAVVMDGTAPAWACSDATLKELAQATINMNRQADELAAANRVEQLRRIKKELDSEAAAATH